MSVSAADRKILVLGSRGQLGRALLARLGERGLGLSRAEAELSDLGSLVRALDRHRPTAVINAAAYTQVDRAESEESVARAINGVAPGALARWCREARIPLLHFSTDYVYGGQGTDPLREDTPPRPLNAYGRTKLEGEHAVAEAGGDHLLLRVSWIFDESGSNFLRTMIRLGQEKEELRVVDDQIGSPSYAGDVAGLALGALERSMRTERFPSGCYNLCPRGYVSWHGFALEIFRRLRARGERLAVREVRPIATSDFPTPALRPLNSRLDTAKFTSAFGLALPTWQEGLDRCLKETRT
jgi:dTDP-4-dehydrorhamnose reductase